MHSGTRPSPAPLCRRAGAQGLTRQRGGPISLSSWQSVSRPKPAVTWHPAATEALFPNPGWLAEQKPMLKAESIKKCLSSIFKIKATQASDLMQGLGLFFGAGIATFKNPTG